jgi:glycosyltransferase involved in cell wall biosynthesis
LDGLAGAKTRGVDFKMIFVGGGSEAEEIKSVSDRLGLSNHCIFTGPINDRELLRAYFSRADMFLFPSTFDTNGIVVREAAACSLGSVLITGSAAAEGVTDGVNGLLIDENALSLANRVMTLINNPSLAKTIGEKARDTLYISWEDSVKRAYSRYECIIDNNRCGKRKIPKIAAGRL